MKFYDFDQEGLGKYMESNSRSNRPSETRVDDIRTAVKKSLIFEIILAIATTVLEGIFHRSLYLIPTYFSIVLGYVWCVTTLRSYFGITGMWRVGILKEERIMAFRKMGLLWIVHVAVLAYFLINIGWYMHTLEEDFRYGLIMWMISGVLTAISYALGYATGNPKQKRWWEFSNYDEVPDHRAW